MQEKNRKKIKKSIYFENTGETFSVEIGVEDASPETKREMVIPFLETLFKRAIGQLDAPVIPDTGPGECLHVLSTEDEKAAGTFDEREFERLMQEWIQEHHRVTFATDTALAKGQEKGSSQDGELVSTLRDIKAILERMEGTSPDTVLGPGTVVDLTSTCAPGITKEDAQTCCRLSQEEFDKMMQYYEKRKSRKIHVDGRGDVPEMVISIPCPPKGGRDRKSVV